MERREKGMIGKTAADGRCPIPWSLTCSVSLITSSTCGATLKGTREGQNNYSNGNASKLTRKIPRH